MNIESLRKEIGLHECVICKAEDEISRIGQLIADHLCPFEVGEKVIDDDGIMAVVLEIRYHRRSNGYNLFVKKIKKDGSLYKYPTQCYRTEQYKKYIEPEGE